MLTPEQLKQLKERGGFVEFTFPNILDHVKVGENFVHLKNNEVIKNPETIDTTYEEVKDKPYEIDKE